MNLEFKAYEPKASDITNVWSLAEVKQQLGLVSITLHNEGNGNFAILKKADGTSTTLPVSAKMQPDQLPQGRLAEMKDGSYVIIRPDGVSSLKTLASV